MRKLCDSRHAFVRSAGVPYACMYDVSRACPCMSPHAGWEWLEWLLVIVCELKEGAICDLSLLPKRASPVSGRHLSQCAGLHNASTWFRHLCGWPALKFTCNPYSCVWIDFWNAVAAVLCWRTNGLHVLTGKKGWPGYRLGCGLVFSTRSSTMHSMASTRNAHRSTLRPVRSFGPDRHVRLGPARSRSVATPSTDGAESIVASVLAKVQGTGEQDPLVSMHSCAYLCGLACRRRAELDREPTGCC
jgi:hypothetical protein